MMLHKKSSGRSYWKLLALLPIVGITLALNAETVTDVVYKNDKPQKQVPIKKGKANGKINTGTAGEIVVVGYGPETSTSDEQNTAVGTFTQNEQNTAVGTFTPASEDKVFDVVEQMPQFSGGIEALLKYLAENVRYPKEAEEKSLQGRVIATFVVEKDGSISRAKVVKSVDPLLDEEALRVVNSMPNWTPGQQNGEPVAVKYTIPISFKLQGTSNQEAKASENMESFSIEIDGVKTNKSMAEVAKELNSDDIQSMNIDKSDPKNPVMKITTKKKK